MAGASKKSQGSASRPALAGTRAEPAANPPSHDSRRLALEAARQVLLRHHRDRPPGATWVSLGEAVAEAVLQRIARGG